MSQYLGDISAYALAVSQGYTGTEEEYAELMASYATVGQTAVTAAQTATTKASEAATSATTATNKATEATTAATTATTKAGEASTSASTATSAKDTAVSAARTATTKATEATTAAATATSAATTATTAKDDAVSAKTAAQTAQTGAETAAASVQSSAAQIATNAEDISQLKSDLSYLYDGVQKVSVTWEEGFIDQSGSDHANSNYYRTVGYIDLNEHPVIELQSSVSGQVIIRQYRSDYAYLNGQDITIDGKYTYTPFAGTRYIRITSAKTVYSSLDILEKTVASTALSDANALKSAVASDFYAITDNIKYNDWSPNKYYINTQLTVGDTVSLTLLPTSSDCRCQVVDCSAEDVFYITGSGSYGIRAWAFVDADSKLLIKSGFPVTADNLKITAPTNAAKLIVNDLSLSGKIIKNQPIIEKLNNLPLEIAQNYIPNKFFSKPYMANGRNKFLMHRGLRSETIPWENSVPSFVNAGKHKAFGCETDICTTSDGVFVCIHDNTIDRTTNGTGRVKDMTYEQLMEYNLINVSTGDVSTYTIPTMLEYLRICKTYAMVPVIEIKEISNENIAPFLALIESEGMTDRCIIISPLERLDAIRAINTSIPCMTVVMSTASNYTDIIESLSTYENVGVDYETYTYLTDELVQTCHDNGLFVGVWTLNTESAAENAFAMGIDLVTSNTVYDWS